MLSPVRILVSFLYQRPSTSTWLTSHVKVTGWRSTMSTSSRSFTMCISLAGKQCTKKILFLKDSKCQFKKILNCCPTSDTKTTWRLNTISLKGEEAGISQRHSVQCERVFLSVHIDATVGPTLELNPVPGPHPFDVGQVERHLKGAALTLGHLHILQTLQHLQPVLWHQKHTWWKSKSFWLKLQTQQSVCEELTRSRYDSSGYAVCHVSSSVSVITSSTTDVSHYLELTRDFKQPTYYKVLSNNQVKVKSDLLRRLQTSQIKKKKEYALNN